jgi:hypothetical protein
MTVIEFRQLYGMPLVVVRVRLEVNPALYVSLTSYPEGSWVSTELGTREVTIDRIWYSSAATPLPAPKSLRQCSRNGAACLIS